MGFNTYNANGMNCGDFNGRVCLVEDPQTGGVRNGQTVGCQIGSFNPTFIFPRTGGVIVYPGGIAAPR
jgi:hypothetical protein